jgi:hypothetical protein
MDAPGAAGLQLFADAADAAAAARFQLAAASPALMAVAPGLGTPREPALADGQG